MSGDIIQTITQAANRYGIDPNTMIAIGRIESSLNPTAQNTTSSAGGLFQFIDSTWKTYGKGANKMDAAANADAAARFTRDNIMYLRRRLGRNPTPGEIYMAHQQGAGGAAKILSNPNGNAAAALGMDAVSLNLPSNMKGMAASITLGEFAQLWTQKVNKAMGGAVPYTATALSPSLNPESNPGFSVYDAMNPEKTSVPVTAVTPTTPISDQRRAALERELQKDSPGFFQAVGDAAYSQNWMFMRDISDAFDNEEIFKATDPNWKPDGTYLRQRFQDAEIPEEYWERFDDAQSEAHLDAMINRTRKIIEADRQLAKLGTVSNIGLRMGVAMLDPVNWAVTAAVGAATGGVGVPALVGGRLGGAALGALQGVAGNLLADTLQQADNKTFGSSDYLLSAASGLIMGGAFGAFANNPALAQKVETIGRNMEREVLENMPGIGDSVGAARAPAKRPGIEGDAAVLRRMADSIAKELDIDPQFKNFRFDISNSLQKQRSSIVKVIGRSMVGDPVGPKKGQLAEIGVDERGALLNRQMETAWSTDVITHWNSYKKRLGLKGEAASQGEIKFRESITDYVWARTDAERAAFEPEVAAAAKRFQSIMAQWTDLLNNPGKITGTDANPVRGAGNLKANDRYAPRVHDHEAIRDLMSKYGFEKIPEPQYNDKGDIINSRELSRGGLTQLVARAIEDATPWLPKRLINKAAYGYLKKVHSLGAGQEVPLSRIIAGEDVDGLRTMLTELLDDVADKRLFSDDEVEEFVKHFQRPNTKAAASANLKHRTLLNETMTVKLPNIDTGQLEEVSMKNLFVRDAHYLMTLYNRHMSGRVALAQWKIPDGKGGLLIDGIDSDAAFDTLLRKVRQIGHYDGLSKGELEKNEKQLKFLYSSIVGYPVYDQGTTFATALRMLNDYNFIRVMGQVGFAQIPELANVASHTGMESFMRAMPALGDLWRNAKTGKLSTKLAQEAEAILGVGTDWVRSTWHLQAEDGVPFGQLPESAKANRMLLNADKALHKGKRFVNAASGMAPVNTLLQRWTGQAIFYQFDKMARRVAAEGGSDVSKLKTRDLNRLKALGLSEDMQKRVFDQIRKHRTGNGKRLEAINLKSWDDVQAASAFEAAAYRYSRGVVLENDLGQMAQWMSHPVAKSIFQFRSFMLGAHSKVLLRGLNHRDLYTFTSFASTIFAGAMTYMAQSYLNAVGRPDFDKQIADRLSLEQIALGGLLRSSWYSTLALPTDMLANTFMGTPLTSYRTTGLATGFFGSPTVDLFNNAFNAAQSVGELTTGNEFSRPDAQAWRSLFPGQNLMGITQIFNLLTSDLPLYEKRN